MRALFAVLLVSALVLSGCAGKGKDDDGDSSSSTSTSKGSTSGTSTSKSGTSSTTATSTTGTGTGGPANRAPTANLTASVAGGPAPLAVTFTLSGGDLDGNPLSWTLAFDDATAPSNGTTLPTTVNHTFAAVGSYNVTLRVSDGKANATANRTVSVVAASGGTPLHFEETLITGSTPLATTFGVAQCVGFNIGQSGLDCAIFELPAAAAGRTYTLGADTSAVEFLTGCAFTDTSLGIQDAGTGTVPATALCAVTWFFGPGVMIPQVLDIA